MAEGNKLGIAHMGSTPAEAELVRSLLEEAGLSAVIPDRNVPLPGLDLTPFDGSYVGTGCAVFVPAEDVDRAKSVLADARAASALAGDSEEDGEDDSGGSDDSNGGEGGAD